ncbi:MAG: GNAT family N-acetyltransferase [Armatimonadetes bacterium]|nr:GNAT family N-acetyltransferase [Armatimonadota bacterium]
MPIAADAVRPPADPAEFDAWYQVFIDTFFTDGDKDVICRVYRAYMEGLPTYRPSLCRGIWRDGRLVSRYGFFDRELLVGPSRLRCGCICGVATLPEARGQGLGARLMWDSVEVARAERWPLLLLAGISNFYHRFGYIDCLDTVEHSFTLEAASALPASSYTVRETTPDDAAAILRLYHGSFGHLTGCFDRTLAEQRLRLDLLPPERAQVVAVDGDGVVRGCLNREWRGWGDAAEEVTAEDEQALLALLHRHVQEAGKLDPVPERLRWYPPEASRELYMLERLVGLHSQRWSRPRGGWMARIGHVGAFWEAMLPVLGQRWDLRPERRLTMVVDGEEHGLHLAGSSARLAAPDGDRVVWSQEALTQAVFGFRPVRWLAQGRGLAQGQALGLEAADDLLPALEALFPLGRPTIARTDDF